MGTRVRWTIAVLAAMLLLSACTAGQSGSGPGSGSAPGGSGAAAQSGAAGGTRTDGKQPAVETVLEQLKTPWSITLHDGTFYMTERGGTVVKKPPGSSAAMERQAVRLVKPVLQQGEGGLLGFVLAPDFARSHHAYAYHTYAEDGETFNRIVLLRETSGGWEEEKPLLERIPGSRYHNGGRLAIGPDGYLYATTGDASEESLSQNKDSLAGKILRLTLDGRIPPDQSSSYVYSYGHRNPQGLTWTPDGTLYSSEHGPSGSPGGHDELNRIERGNNYGWPLVIGDETKPDLVPPLLHSGERAFAPSGIAADPSGQVWVTALVGETLFRYDPKVNKLHVELQQLGRLRDVLVAGDYVYVITSNTDGRGHPKAGDDRLVRFKLPQ
ncbi:sorbosone dehydrogenase family protein [Paenibacillus sp. YYML68]|uniref:PQQ-dependent sugar dehydrogenase n=1 Tax=Paenibacillus sp. YYML68 TaxID=2909250 RepID=UPI002490F2B7|nr:PQQ-dependent sugar dehydrogenase [Paenibacillus sp. YYML68]